MKVTHSIEVSFQHTNDAKQAKEWLDNLPDLFAADFETAVRYSSEVVEEAKLKMVDENLPRIEQVKYQAIANATALGHPSHCTITHCSIAAKEDEAFIFVIDNQEIADVVLDFLTETTRTQVWHNYSYDGRFLRYYQGKDAINVEDSQVLAKTLLNHVEVFKASARLKDLMGAHYGDWGISADNFTLEQQHDLAVIEYAGIDACATYKLWELLNNFVRDNNQPD